MVNKNSLRNTHCPHRLLCFVGTNWKNTIWRWSEIHGGKTVLQWSETHNSILKLLIFEFTNCCNTSQIAVMPVLAQGPTVCPSFLGQNWHYSSPLHQPLLENNGSEWPPLYSTGGTKYRYHTYHRVPGTRYQCHNLPIQESWNISVCVIV
jgi:hypothetical protein